MPKIKIPFSGFYDTVHSFNIKENSDGVEPDWAEVRRLYAKAYAEALGELSSLESLKFFELKNLKENFTTDNIICEISESDVARLVAETDDCEVRKVARQWFTSGQGFVGYYNPNVYYWGPVDLWDHNQLGAVLQAFLNKGHTFGGFGEAQEVWLVEPLVSSGKVAEMLHESKRKHNEKSI